MALFLLGVVLLIVGWLSRLRLLPRNWLVGIRTPSTMRTPVAWRSGHEAAAGEMILAGSLTMVGGLLAELLPVSGSAVSAATLVLSIGLLLHASTKAVRAARLAGGGS